jgi:predicted MFS family arabinose efflux permease
MLSLGIGLVLGAIIGGFVVYNNQKKALALLQVAKAAAEAELAKVKK